MLFGKYHIVIFKEKSGASRNLRFRGWLGVFLFLLFAGLVTGNLWLWEHYQEATSLRDKLAAAERALEEQGSHITGMVSRLSDVQESLDRVQQFDSKLRLMMNMEKDPTDVAGVGGAAGDDFSSSYLPLHRRELTVRKMNDFLKQLATDVRLEEVRQQDLLLTLRTNREILVSLPSVWPVAGFITSRFGSRPSPFTGSRESHKGLDISARPGTPIYAPGKGTVAFASADGAYGNSVILQHGGGLSTRYAHMQRFVVREGQILNRGDLIGYVGSTGRVSGPHLHYEVMLNGLQVDPMRYILN